MKRFLLPALCLLVFAWAGPARAADPSGLWLTENGRAVIAIDRCGESLCGKVAWIAQGGLQQDVKNPDPGQRSRPMCGLTVLTGFQQQDADQWIDGTIYKADDGDTYHAMLQTLPSGKLLVRGYIGMKLFGQSQTWTRVSDRDYPPCTASAAFWHQRNR